MSILPKESRQDDPTPPTINGGQTHRLPIKGRQPGSGCPTITIAPSARDGVTAANSGEHFPKRIENALRRRAHLIDVVIVDVAPEQFALDGRMFAVGFDMDAEIFVILRINEAVMLLQPVDLRFTDFWNLALVGVKRGQTFGRRSIAAY